MTDANVSPLPGPFSRALNNDPSTFDDVSCAEVWAAQKIAEELDRALDSSLIDVPIALQGLSLFRLLWSFSLNRLPCSRSVRFSAWTDEAGTTQGAHRVAVALTLAGLVDELSTSPQLTSEGKPPADALRPALVRVEQTIADVLRATIDRLTRQAAG